MTSSDEGTSLVSDWASVVRAVDAVQHVFAVRLRLLSRADLTTMAATARRLDPLTGDGDSDVPNFELSVRPVDEPERRHRDDE